MTAHVLRISTLLLVVAVPAASGQTPLTLTLDDAIARAMEVSHRLAEARAREAGAHAAIRTRHAADQPTVHVSAGYSRTNHVEEFGVAQPGGGFRVIYPDVPNNFLSRLSLQWPIYNGGRNDALERAAEAEARASAADVQAARADLRLEVVRAYWALATAGESVRVLAEGVERAEAHLRDVRSRFDAGLIAPNEVSSAEAQRSRQQMQLIEARNLRSSVLEELRRLTGVSEDVSPADPLEPQSAPSPPSPPSAQSPQSAQRITTDATGAVQQATGVSASIDGSRPEHQAVVERIAAAEQRRKAAEAARRPLIAATGAFDYARPNARIFPRQDEWRGSWELGVNVNWTLWDGGRVAAETAEAAAAVTAARARRDELDSLIALDVRQRALDVTSARAVLDAAIDAVRSAAEARRVVGERFNVGVATGTDVLDAQMMLLQSELDRTRALANIRLAEARLDRALGR